MNFNHDSGAIVSILTIDTTVAPPLGGSNSLQIVGTGGLALPSGTTAQRPSGVPAGTQRWNTDTAAIETYDGAAWTADQGGTVTSVTVESTSTALTVTNGTVTTEGTISLALNAELNSLSAINTDVDGPVVRLDNGQYVARILEAGNGIDITNGDGQAGNPSVAVEANLQGLNTLATDGFVTQVSVGGVNTYVTKSFAAAGDITLDEAAGVLTFGYTASGDSAAISAMTGEGVVVRTDDGTEPGVLTYATRALEGTAGNTVVTNGDFVAGNAIVNLAEITQGATGDFKKVTLDGFGRVTGNAAVTTADITALVDDTYVNVTGDSMSGNLAFNGTATVIGLTSPVNATDAATKGYVDSLVGGVSWQEPVAAIGATLPVTATIGTRFLNTTDGKIYTATAADTFDTGMAPADGFAVFDQSTETGYVYSGTEWVQFTGTGQITAGAGLSKDGNVINVNLGAGIAQLPSDEVGLDIVSGALFLTENGTDASTGTAAQLALRTGTGISQTLASGIYIADGAIDNAKLANSVITVTGTAGNDAVALGESLAVVGASAPITTAVDAETNTLTIAVADATVDAKGLASFNTAQFSVTAGAVSLAADLEDLLNVDMTTVAKAAGDLISWDATAGKWVPVSQASVAPDLAFNDLTDVTITSVAAGHVVYYKDAIDGFVNAAPGSTSGVQAYDLGLDSLSALATTGIVVASADNTFVTRALVAGNGVEITGDLTTGDLTIANTGVTSVALALPSIFTVSGSPVTTTGTLTGELATQASNLVFAGPATGADAAPTFRSLAYADLPIKLYSENRASEIAPSATGANAVAVGSAAVADLAGEVAHAAGQFAAAGDAQALELVLRNATADATATELFLDGTAARAVLANSTAWNFSVQVVGLKADGTAAAGYRFDGVVLRGANAAATSFIGTPSKNILGETSSAWDAAVIADTTNGSLSVSVTGAAATSIRWVATVRATQVKF